MLRSFTDEELVVAVAHSTNMSGVCNELRLYKCGATYIVLNRNIVRLNLDTSHWDKVQVRDFKKIPTCDILVENSPYLSGTSNLKARLLREGLLKYKCYNCGISEWDGKEISLQLDHINGDRYDNRIDNLRLLCPNCHSQTGTYGGKRHKRDKKKGICECGQPKSKQSQRCRRCDSNVRLGQGAKIVWPNGADLAEMLERSSYVQVGKQLGVSDNAVRKHIQRLNR